jgi:hypothetical protein
MISHAAILIATKNYMIDSHPLNSNMSGVIMARDHIKFSHVLGIRGPSVVSRALGYKNYSIYSFSTYDITMQLTRIARNICLESQARIDSNRLRWPSSLLANNRE